MIAVSATNTFAQPLTVPGAPCVRPPVQHCPDSGCAADVVNEISELPKTSAWVQKYECSAETKRREVIDTKAGYVFDGTRQNPGSRRGDFGRGRARGTLKASSRR